eukprot:scaffold250639_cov36-Tisochrysis_lutea.AAC.2
MSIAAILTFNRCEGIRDTCKAYSSCAVKSGVGRPNATRPSKWDEQLLGKVMAMRGAQVWSARH